MAKRITQLLRNNSVFTTKESAINAILAQDQIDGQIVLASYKASGESTITTLAGLQTNKGGNNKSTTLIANEAQVQAIVNALQDKIGLSGASGTITIGTGTNAITYDVITFNYTPPSNSNFLTGSTSIKDSLQKLDAKLKEVKDTADTTAGGGITSLDSDGSIDISTPSGNSNERLINVNIKSGEHILAKDNTSKQLYTDIKLQKITTDATSQYAAQYKLVGTDGTQLGTTVIDIPRDQVIKRAYLADADNIEIISSDTTSTAKYMVFEVYTGTTSSATTTLSVDIGRFFEELEAGNIANNIAGDGLQYNSTNQKLSVKIDSTSEGYLTISANGIKLSGVTNAINSAVGSIKVNNQTQDAAHNITIGAGNINLTGYEVSTETNKTNLVPATSDSVNTAISKLYRTIQLDESDISNLNTRVQTLENKTLTAGNGIDTTNNIISVDLDTNTTGKGTSATTHNQYSSDNWNALELSSDGLYLSSIWDCGTY